MAGVDGDKSLSATGKAERKRELATKALAGLEQSASLSKAQEAVRAQLEAWSKELAAPAIDVTMAAEIRRHVAQLPDGERLAFAAKHVAEAGPAILAGPSFLSGLTPAEVEIVRRHFETETNPELAAKKAKVTTALADVEAGFRNAANTIRTRAGLDTGNGMAIFKLEAKR